MSDARQPRPYLRPAIDETPAVVVLEAEVETMRATYGDEAVREAMRKVAQGIVMRARAATPKQTDGGA